MKLSELSLRVDKLEEIIQELAKWTNFNLILQKDTSDKNPRENRSRLPNVRKSKGRKVCDLDPLSSVEVPVIKVELADEQNDAEVYDDEEQNKDGDDKTSVKLEFDLLSNPDNEHDPLFIPSDGGENSESDVEGIPEPRKKRRMSAKMKYEALKVLRKSSLPPSEPFVSLRPLTSSQLLTLPQKKSRKGNDLKLKRPSNSNSPKSRIKKEFRHRSDTRLACLHCPYSGKNQTLLSTHILSRHPGTGHELFKCPHCIHAVKHQHNLTRHIQSMHPQEGEEEHRPFKCPECPKTFRFRYGLSAHTLRLHKNKEKSFLCDACPYLGINPSALQRHIQNHHAEKKYPLSCYFCPWMGENITTLSSHMRTHTGERPYKCPHCIFTTTEDQTLKDHVKNGHGNEEGTFQCEKCSCKFRNKLWLKRHQQLHDGSAIKCGICEFEALNRDYLRDHLKCHKTEDGRFQCPHCPKTFKSRFVIQAHIRIHHSYKCGNCPCSFKEQSQLISHNSTCKSSLGHEDLKDKQGLPEQAAEPIVPAEQVESEDVIPMASILGI